MFIASRGREIVLPPAAAPASPSKSEPTPEPFSLKRFGHLPVPSVFEHQPLGHGQSLFPIQVTRRDYSFPPDGAALAKILSIAILEFEDYRRRLRKLRFKAKRFTELSAASDMQSDQGSTR